MRKEQKTRQNEGDEIQERGWEGKENGVEMERETDRGSEGIHIYRICI